MKNTFNQLASAVAVKVQASKEKMVSFVKDEKSAKGATEEGYMIYVVVIIGIIVLGIGAGFMTDGFTTLGGFFQDGITGTDRDADGWGN